MFFVIIYDKLKPQLKTLAMVAPTKEQAEEILGKILKNLRERNLNTAIGYITETNIETNSDFDKDNWNKAAVIQTLKKLDELEEEKKMANIIIDPIYPMDFNQSLSPSTYVTTTTNTTVPLAWTTIQYPVSVVGNAYTSYSPMQLQEKIESKPGPVIEVIQKSKRVIKFGDENE